MSTTAELEHQAVLMRKTITEELSHFTVINIAGEITPIQAGVNAPHNFFFDNVVAHLTSPHWESMMYLGVVYRNSHPGVGLKYRNVEGNLMPTSRVLNREIDRTPGVTRWDRPAAPVVAEMLGRLNKDQPGNGHPPTDDLYPLFMDMTEQSAFVRELALALSGASVAFLSGLKVSWRIISKDGGNSPLLMPLVAFQGSQDGYREGKEITVHWDGVAFYHYDHHNSITHIL